MADSLNSVGPGDLVVIERRRRPWRLSTVLSVQGDVLQIAGGFLFSVATGWRLDAAHDKHERAVPMTEARMDYLMLRQFQKAMTSFDPSAVPPERLHRLAQLAREFGELLQVDARLPDDQED